MTSFDVIVVGGGLTGLLLSHRLHLSGRKVGLIEARESLGGRYRRANSTQPFSSPGLDFIPLAEEHLELLAWLKNVSPLPFNFERVEYRPQMYGEGQWKPFTGFGNMDFPSIGELSLFNQPFAIDMQPGLEQLTRALTEQLPVEPFLMSHVTGFKAAEGRVTEVVINGDKALKAEQFIFTPHPMLLNDLFEGEALAAKNRSRIAKMPAWTAVTLELTHSAALAEDNAIRIFTHSSQEFEPVVGRAFGNRSKWMTLIDPERTAEHEFTGQCLRHIKKQLKRAWPNAFDNKPEEKIYVQANAIGLHSLRTKDPHRFPELSNFYLANHCLATLPSELASIQTARNLEIELIGTLNQLPELGASC